jgi:hypothetical protein
MLKNVSILHDQYKKYGIQGSSHNPLLGSPSSAIHLQYTYVTTVTDKLDNQDILRYCNIQVCHNTSQYTAKVTVIH